MFGIVDGFTGKVQATTNNIGAALEAFERIFDRGDLRFWVYKLNAPLTFVQDHDEFYGRAELVDLLSP